MPQDVGPSVPDVSTHLEAATGDSLAMPRRRLALPLSFVDGIGVGIGGLMLLPLLYWMVVHGSYVEMYRQFGNVRLPSPTIFAMGPLWSYGAPILLGIGFAMAIWLRPTRWLIFAIGGATLIAAIFTYYAAYMPVWQLAGNLR